MTGLLPCLLLSLASTPLQSIPQETETGKTSQVLIEHVHQIFQAFIARDRDRIRALHTDDWIGFLGPSTNIERGIEDYMRNADLSLASFRGVGYELLESEVQVFGDLAIVYYIARYDYESEDGSKGSIPLRSVDIFRRADGEWCQSASHISVIPSGGKWGEGGN